MNIQEGIAGERLAARITSLFPNLKNTEIERKFGFGKGDINNWKRGSIPQIWKLAAVAKDRGVSLDWMIFGESTANVAVSHATANYVRLLERLVDTHRLICEKNQWAAQWAGETETMATLLEALQEKVRHEPCPYPLDEAEAAAREPSEDTPRKRRQNGA